MAIQVFWTISSEHDSKSISCRYFIHKSFASTHLLVLGTVKKMRQLIVN